jgi:4-aminobutyrate aminotransferase
MLIEPVLGEGGYVVPPLSFMQGLRKICDEHGILLITDEIQTGYGRTGRWFAFEHFGIVPDIMTVAKGIASGLPLSGVFSRRELMDQWKVGTHGGTFGGNVIACAAGAETVRVIRDEKLVQNAAARGEQLQVGLRHLQEKHEGIADVRGLGLMVGAEFRDAQGRPDTKLAKTMLHECQDDHLLLLTCGPWDNTIRFMPPLIVTGEQIEKALGIFDRALTRTEKKA